MKIQFTLLFMLSLVRGRLRILQQKHLKLIYWLYLDKDFLLLCHDEIINMYVLFSAFTCRQTSLLISEKPGTEFSIHPSGAVWWTDRWR
jgi:hypothetical protein